MTLINDAQVDDWLQQHGAWRREDATLTRTIECPSFPAAIELVRVIAEVAEQRDHHPDIDIRWRTLHLRLSTHSEGGITDKDTSLAAAIDELAAGSSG